MLLHNLEFGALLSYTPRGDIKSKDLMLLLKRDSYVEDPPILMSQWIAKVIKQYMNTLPFATFFQTNTVLVPTPKSSLMQRETLWVPHRIATALVEVGLGKQIIPYLTRTKAVPKAASSPSNKRPLPAEHYESMEVHQSLSKPNDIVLVDDIVTRGATLLGAASLLKEVFPNARIRGFAAMRTISNPIDFKNFYDPCIGTIELRDIGDTIRRP
jgi:predicted amidophosphoribosyltransferase